MNRKSKFEFQDKFQNKRPFNQISNSKWRTKEEDSQDSDIEEEEDSIEGELEELKVLLRELLKECRNLNGKLTHKEQSQVISATKMEVDLDSGTN